MILLKKALSVATILLLCTTVISSCENKSDNNSIDQQIEETKNNIEEEREELEKELQETKNRIDKKATELRAEAKEETGEAKEALNKKVAELEAYSEEVEKDLEEAREATAEGWAEFKQDTKNALNNIETKLKNLFDVDGDNENNK